MDKVIPIWCFAGIEEKKTYEQNTFIWNSKTRSFLMKNENTVLSFEQNRLASHLIGM